MKRITVFCGANYGNNPAYAKAATELAALMVQNNIGLVYGGGNIGLMGHIADEVMRLGGEAIGVIPKKLMDREVGHQGLTKLYVVDTMHERKALMAELCDGFIAMPGGIGTLEEIIEVFTWLQLEYHHKPCALLNVAGYYNALTAFFNQMVTDGFLTAQTNSTMLVDENPAALLNKMEAFYIQNIPAAF
jgi:uncharacterized protein (TIGR00730 family)